MVLGLLEFLEPTPTIAGSTLPEVFAVPYITDSEVKKIAQLSYIPYQTDVRST